MSPLFAIQFAVRHAVSKFSYYFTELECRIATHYFQKFRHSALLDIVIFIYDMRSNRA